MKSAATLLVTFALGSGAIVGCGDQPESNPLAPSPVTPGITSTTTSAKPPGDRKIVLCHNGSTGFEKIEVALPAEAAHRAHGDAAPGEPVPGVASNVFDGQCRPVDAALRITSGSWEVDPLGVALFSLSESDIAFAGRWGFALGLGVCSRCTVGQSVSINALFDNQFPMTDIPQATGSATIRGVQYPPPIEFGGPLRFVADPFILPAPASPGAAVVVKTPFSMSGQLKGYFVIFRRDPELAFDVPVSGHGTATVTFLGGNFWRLRFDFEP